MRLRVSEFAAGVAMILIEVVMIVATAFIIARTIKLMCLAALARDVPGIDDHVSQLFAFVIVAVIQGGLLATSIVLFPRRKDHLALAPAADTQRPSRAP